MGTMVSHSTVKGLVLTLNKLSGYYTTGLTAEVVNVSGFGIGIVN